MEVIQDELKKNNVRIDIETLTEHIEYILNNYRDSYNDSVNRLLGKNYSWTFFTK